MHRLAFVPHGEHYAATTELRRLGPDSFWTSEIEGSSDRAPLTMVLFIVGDMPHATTSRHASLVLPLGRCQTFIDCCMPSTEAGFRQPLPPLRIASKVGRAVLVAQRRLDGSPDPAAGITACPSEQDAWLLIY
ncbi:unnamed protein product, partial [Symbiodinium pilosum]